MDRDTIKRINKNLHAWWEACQLASAARSVHLSVLTPGMPVGAAALALTTRIGARRAQLVRDPEPAPVALPTAMAA